MSDRTAEQLLERVPPQNVDAEQAALGAMLLERDAIERAVEIIKPEDFYRDAHRWVYRGILELFNHNEPVDLITLGEWLRSHAAAGTPTPEDNLLAQIGGTLYLTTLMESAPTAAGIAHYAGIVREKSVQRRLITIADEIMTDAYLGAKELDALLRESEGKLLELTDAATSNRFAGMQPLHQAVRQGQERRRDADTSGFDVGFKPSLRGLNWKLLPCAPGSLWLIGGEPSRGKSVLAMQFAIEMAEQGACCLIVSLEMDADALARRMVQARTGMNMFEAEQVSYRIDHAATVYSNWDATAEYLEQLGVTLLDIPQCTPMDLLAAGRRARKMMGALDIIVVDYLQLMESDDASANSDDTRRVTALSRSLRPVSKILKAGMIAVSSLNRPKQEYANVRPTMSRLRQSGQLDFDADAVLLLHRPDPNDKEQVEVIIDKQRHGPTGSVDLHLDTRRLWFTDGSDHQSNEQETAYQSWGGGQ
ncbi:MAG: replicative DNA helicase [Armatimonadota bacterium]